MFRRAPVNECAALGELVHEAIHRQIVVGNSAEFQLIPLGKTHVRLDRRLARASQPIGHGVCGFEFHSRATKYGQMIGADFARAEELHDIRATGLALEAPRGEGDRGSACVANRQDEEFLTRRFVDGTGAIVPPPRTQPLPTAKGNALRKLIPCRGERLKLIPIADPLDVHVTICDSLRPKQLDFSARA